MSNKDLQGYAISQALNELEKFASEIDSLIELVENKIPNKFKQSSDYKLDQTLHAEQVTNSYWFYEWKGLSVPVLRKRSKKNVEGYLLFQFSFCGNSVSNQLNGEYPQGMPLVHVSFWDAPLKADETYMCFPLSQTDRETSNLQLKCDNKLILWEEENYNNLLWTFSIPLLHIVASNIDDLLLTPAYELIHSKESIHSIQFGQSIISYPSLESISN